MLFANQLIGLDESVCNGPWQSYNTAAGINAAVTLNPSDKSARITLSGGNLTAVNDGTTNHALVRATLPVSHLAWVYWEVTFAGMGAGSPPVNIIGVQDANLATSSNLAASPLGAGWGFGTGTGQAYLGGFTGTISTPLSNSTLGIAYKGGFGEIWLRNASGWLNGNPTLGNSPTLKIVAPNNPVYAAMSMFGSPAGSATFNFGASAFVYSVP